MRNQVLFLLVATVLMLASCGNAESTQATTQPEVETTASATSTTAPTTTTMVVEEKSSSDAGPFPADEPVDLLVLTDSSGWGIAERFAPLAAQALKREIQFDDWARGGEPITKILDWMQTILADKVAEAEIIVMYAFLGGLEYDLPELKLMSCFDAADAVLVPEEYAGDWTPGTKWKPAPAVATVEEWQPYRDVLDQVYDEIWKLRAGQPTIIRTYDVPLGFIAAWKELGIESECVRNWEVQTQVIREAAEANGAGFVSLFDVFNGPNHDEDPNEKGWMMDDLMHAGDEGRDIIAEALAAYGFEVSEPPR
jgi:hypothetical protein